MRTIRSYADVLYHVRALACACYPSYRQANFESMIWEEAGIDVPVGEDPTLSQLYLVEEWLLDQLNEMHEQTLMLLGQQGRREESA